MGTSGVATLLTCGSVQTTQVFFSPVSVSGGVQSSKGGLIVALPDAVRVCL